MTEPVSLLVICLAFVAGGAVKGLAGLGLPVITVAVLTFAFGLPNAMALMVVPGLVSNAWQALSGGYINVALRRIAVFLVPSLFTIWLGTGLLVRLEAHWLVAMLGIILSIYAITGISGAKMQVSPDREKWIGPLLGMVNGVTTGMTGVTSTPAVIYINGLGMRREVFIQALGLLFFISYVVLTASLWMRGLVNLEVGSLSAIATVPTLLGMWMGRAFRLRTSEAGFRRLFFRVLLIIGVYLIARSLIF